jgi:hypothetical protein
MGSPASPTPTLPAQAVTPTAAPTPAAAAQPTPAAAAGVNRATLVVQLDGMRSLVRPITFTAPISGLAALERSGLALVTSATEWGPAVCSIAGVGCPA